MDGASQTLQDRMAALIGSDTLTVSATPKPKVRLYTQTSPPTPATPIGDFTLPTYDGYADLASTTVTTFMDSLTKDWLIQLVRTAGFVFESSGSNTVSSTIQGLVVTDGATTPTTVYWWQALDEPVTINGPNQGIPVTPALRINAATLS